MIKHIILILSLLIAGISNCYAWECIGRVMMCHTWRMSVPTGWIVAGDNSAGGGDHGYAMTFVPDPQHAWKL